MSKTLEFNAWAIQPGNYRLLRSICDSLKQLLNRKITVRSWTDLYNVFEEAILKNDASRALFEGIFEDCPPSEKTGATKSQIMLYRGAKVSGEAQNPPQGDKVVTYRGQTIVKKVNTPTPEYQDKPLRTYRGAPVK